MIAELGPFSLFLALIAALIQGFLPLAGAALGVRSWVNVARPAVFANAVFCTFAFCCLVICWSISEAKSVWLSLRIVSGKLYLKE